MTKTEINKAKKMLESKRPAENYSVINYEGHPILEARYTDITKNFGTLQEVKNWINNS